MIWPPRSPDLTPIDFFLCGHIKALTYTDLDQMFKRTVTDLDTQPTATQQRRTSAIKNASLLAVGSCWLVRSFAESTDDV